METEEPCETRLRKFLSLNCSCEMLEQEIVDRFCALSDAQLANFTALLVPQLDIGSLMQQVCPLV